MKTRSSGVACFQRMPTSVSVEGALPDLAGDFGRQPFDLDAWEEVVGGQFPLHVGAVKPAQKCSDEDELILAGVP